VVAYAIGTGGGAGEAALPGIVLGPPHGGGAFQGSTHTFSLGLGGWIILELTGNVIVDGPGADFTVFENAFLQHGEETGPPFAEPATVSVSADGENFLSFPCRADDPPYYPGCAGVYPVFANADDPAAPSPGVPTTTPIEDLVGIPVDQFTPPPGSGGDSFDLADVGLSVVRFVRIEASDRVAGLGGLAGFDLDAVAAVNSAESGNDACTRAVAVSKPKLTIGKLTTPPGDDKLALKGGMMLPLPFVPALDPAGGGVRVLIDHAAGRLLDAAIPGGVFDRTSKVGWKTSKAGTAWTYSNPSGILGVRKVIVKLVPRTPGLVKFAVAGKDGSYAVRREELPLRATLVLDADAGQCGEATFPGPSPAPSCAFNASGSRLDCK
jgi:hypothetical protein